MSPFRFLSAFARSIRCALFLGVALGRMFYGLKGEIADLLDAYDVYKGRPPVFTHSRRGSWRNRLLFSLDVLDEMGRMAGQQRPLDLAVRVTFGMVSMAHLAVKSLDRVLGPKAIVLPPGWRLRRLASFLYSERTYERVFKQHLIDIEYEYIEALKQNQWVKARWVHVRGVISFWVVVIVHASTSSAVVAFGVVRTVIFGS
jgi:hypothetical protein